MRRLAPAGLRAADLWLFRRAAETHIAGADRTLNALSVAANHGRLWMAVALLLGTAGGRAGRRAALRGLFGLGLASAVTNLPAKLIARRVRPDIDLVPAARRLARLPRSSSFPSGHAASAAAFAVGAAIEAPRAALPVGALAATVAYSRVHTGVHYPLDVVAGAGIGAAAALATTRLWPPAPREPATAATRSTGPLAPCPRGEGLVVIVNASAGGGDEAAERIRSLLPAAACRVVTDPDALSPALQEAAEEAVVLGIAGGDGSVGTAAAVAQAADVPLAVFPSGTLNHFARDVGLHDLAATATAVERGYTVVADLAAVDGHPFVNSATLGGYPELVAARERLEDRIGKWPAVLIGVARVLRAAEPVTVDIDGTRRRLWLAFIGNCRFEPSGFAPSRRLRLDDGTLDIRLVDGDLPLARTRLLAALLCGRLARSRVYAEHQASRLRIEAQHDPPRVTRDGELTSVGRAFTFEKRPTRLAVVAPDLASAGSGALVE